MWYNVENIEWGNELDENNEIIIQGLKIKGKDIMLSELFEQITWEDEKVPNLVSERFPNINSNEYKSAIRIIWLLLKSIEYSPWLAQIENNGKMNFQQLEKSLISYKLKMNLFQEDPNDFLGINEDE